ncbi:hypothetical protein J1605_003253 [Eschrichtius robustus]|uniref:Lipid-binding serum glycoprotein N-terminal domain-containing protein n=1 Tax=Eschrichtius robustus TaxID=9764 RepID=A0AB34HRJ4_ESCRO|nr:hypothetical protein J1605_003253 [Eschrichtius robustus]
MLLFWGSLLCWRLLPQAPGEAQHLVFLRFSKDQLETDISGLLSKHHVLDHVARIPVMGATSKGVAILDHRPFVREGLSKGSSGLDLLLVGDLLSGQSFPLLGELLQLGGVVTEDAKGPEVTLQILSDSLLQVTLQSKLILWLKVTKNFHVGVRLEQTGNKTSVAFEECHTPPGYLSTEVLEQMDPLLVNKALGLVTDVLDDALPFLLQKIGCPLATTLLNSLLEDLLHITLSPAISGPEDFQYYVTSTEFTEEAILMKVQEAEEKEEEKEQAKEVPLPKLAPGSLADLAFSLETYNDILSCLYTSKEIHVNLQDPTAADLIQLLSLRALEPGPKVDFEIGNVPVGQKGRPTIDLLREQGLRLPNVNGSSFDQPRMERSKDYLLLTVPEE